MFITIEKFSATLYEFLHMNSFGLVFIISALAVICIIFLSAKNMKYKKRLMELELYSEDMGKALGEYRMIKHQYNNMLQSILCYIENEQWDAILEYKNEFLNKTAEFNRNNILQIIKIKNYKIRNELSEILKACDKHGIDLNIGVSGDVNIANLDTAAYCKVVSVLFEKILYEVMKSIEKRIDIKVYSDSKGITVIFKSSLTEGRRDGNVSSSGVAPLNIVLKRYKNIIFNNYINQDSLIHEIMISPDK